MTRKTRWVLLGVCAIVFFIAAPYIVFYSLGYRVNFTTWKIHGTGGIYVYAAPEPESILIDNRAAKNTGLFSTAVFAQNLLPGPHSVLITKEGYHDYQKTLEVKEKEVTKLETVTLFKKDIAFQIVPAALATATQPALTAKEQFANLAKPPTELFIIKNNTLYYADVPENAPLTALQKTTPAIKNIVTHKTVQSAILWLGIDGMLYRSDARGQNTQTVSTTALSINKKKTYKLESLASHIFLQEDRAAFLLNAQTGEFENFYPMVDGMELSPDGQKIAYYNTQELWYWLPKAGVVVQNILLQKTQGAIKNVYWLNNDYLIFSESDTIVISEIDVRGNINTIRLPQTIVLAEAITIKNPALFFEQQDKKLYLLTQNTLMVSERLVP